VATLEGAVRGLERAATVAPLVEVLQG
jgi:hypothetical protein